jgi:hypothetical protein
MRKTLAAATAAAALVLAAPAAAQAPDPADFTTKIDNPYWPMRPGSRWVYVEHEGGVTQRDVVTVTHRTRKLAGVTTRVVRDVVTQHGRVIEDTSDYYAQDREGTLWYFGERTVEISRGGKRSTEGSWLAGRDGAEAGIVIPAHPQVGMSYRQEYRKGVAEDEGRVLSLDEQVEVPFGHWRRTLMTKDFTRLEPRQLEHKFYARGVGPVLTLGLSGSVGREELIRFRR